MELKTKKLLPRALVKACRETGQRLHDAAQTLGMALDGSQWIDVKPLKPEIGALKTLFNQFTFSPAYYEWSAKKRRLLVRELCTDEAFQHASKNWAILGTNERTTIVKDIGERIQKIYSQNKTLFPPKNLAYRFYAQGRPPGDAPYFDRGRATKSMLKWECYISLNTHKDAGFDDFETAINSAFHESLHAVHFALMDYFKHCPDRDTHPLKDDMEMLHHTGMINFKKYGRISPLYHANPWERDAHRQSKQFVRELRTELHTLNRNDPTPPLIPPGPR